MIHKATGEDPSTVEFRITFHSPFRVGTGGGDTQTDRALDPDNPLPASTVKGLMRDAARILLPVRPAPTESNPDRVHDHPLVDAVYGGRPAEGGRAVPSPWHWEDGELEAYPDQDGWDGTPVTQRVRIALTDGVVKKHALVVGDELWASSALVQIWLRGSLSAEHQELHRALLMWSAALMDGLGGDRRRGLGWASVHIPQADEKSLQVIRSAAAEMAGEATRATTTKEEL